MLRYTVPKQWLGGSCTAQPIMRQTDPREHQAHDRVGGLRRMIPMFQAMIVLTPRSLAHRYR